MVWGLKLPFGFVIVSLVQLQIFHRLWALINLMTEAMRLFLSKHGGGSVIVAQRYIAAMKTYRIGWCDCWQKKIEFELYGSLLSAYIQINYTKLIRWQPKHAIGVTSENKHNQLNMNAWRPDKCLFRKETQNRFFFFFWRVLSVWRYNRLCESAFVSVCSWWGPVLTCSDWCPSWSLSLFHLWSSFSQSSSSSSQRCCPPPLRRRQRRHVHTTQARSCMNDFISDWLMII